jgi:two-component system sensor histidine kinase DcuS
VPDCPNEKQVTVLVTVLGNLIENALDAMSGQAEGEVGLLLHYQNGWLSGEVSDDGPGIPEALSMIFLIKASPPKAKTAASGCFSPASSSRTGRHAGRGVRTWRIYSIFCSSPWDSKRKSA